MKGIEYLERKFCGALFPACLPPSESRNKLLSKLVRKENILLITQSAISAEHLNRTKKPGKRNAGIAKSLDAPLRGYHPEIFIFTPEAMGVVVADVLNDYRALQDENRDLMDKNNKLQAKIKTLNDGIEALKDIAKDMPR